MICGGDPAIGALFDKRLGHEPFGSELKAEWLRAQGDYGPLRVVSPQRHGGHRGT